MRHTCSHDGCAHLAVERCFDCGAHLCATHATTIQVPTYGDPLREVVCVTCLQSYLTSPGPFGPALIERDIATFAPASGTLPGIAPA
ncbi:MAG TPA: hypothetical protein VF832_11015 [Longimicrobiales bacterium]